ncbi:MAG TPA: hypothetical protein PKI81_11510 [bacterium]|nr:hypothetical protein [bacterium]
MKKWNGRSLWPAILLMLAAAGMACREDANPAAPSGYDLDKNPVPRFVRVNYIDAGRMARISRFRSAAAGDYSDDFEHCRSMLHYFEPRSDLEWSSLPVFSPVNGKIVRIVQNQPVLEMVIQAQEYPDFEFHLFNLSPLEPLMAGSAVRAGESVGSYVERQTPSAIAVSVNTTRGRRLISWFDVLTDSLLQIYGKCGIGNATEFIISREERDADPLTCSNGLFTSGGGLENWAVMNCHWDLDGWGIPRFVDVNYIDFERVNKISRFRSAIGHDYSDDEEDCRSMKHYFWLDGSAGWESARIYAPVNGTVVWRFEEFLGTQIWIRSDEYPDFQFGIFHLLLADSTLAEGRKVLAGELLGTHFSGRTYSDIATAFITPYQRRLISYFDVMTDGLFQRYQARGLAERSDVIISRAERDAHPLTCAGEAIISGMGVLEDWVTLR